MEINKPVPFAAEIYEGKYLWNSAVGLINDLTGIKNSKIKKPEPIRRYKISIIRKLLIACWNIVIIQIYIVLVLLF